MFRPRRFFSARANLSKNSKERNKGRKQTGGKRNPLFLYLPLLFSSNLFLSQKFKIQFFFAAPTCSSRSGVCGWWLKVERRLCSRSSSNCNSTYLIGESKVSNTFYSARQRSLSNTRTARVRASFVFLPWFGTLTQMEELLYKVIWYSLFPIVLRF